jgi:S-DNA-T family DNA segregation ATPase FtsK/SpoIIIE
MKTLTHAIKGLFRKPNRRRKLIVFLSVAAVLFVLGVITALTIENVILAFIVRWAWIPLSVLFLIIRHGEIRTRHNYDAFFESISHVGYDNRTPDFLYSIPHNRFLRKVRFKSRIHPNQWSKREEQIEMYHNQKVYKTKTDEEDLRMTDIYLVEEKLPKFIMWDNCYMEDGRRFAIGESYNGKVVWDAVSTPHGIIAGATGGGKTALLRSIINQAMQKHFNVSILDFKNGGDYSGFENEYQKYSDFQKDNWGVIVSEPEVARNLLNALTSEVKRRMEDFKKEGVPNIDAYNKKLGHNRHLPWLLVIDEAAEILDVKPKDKASKELYTEIEQSLKTLARVSRAAGIHILLGIIRPDSSVLDGQIKNNMQLRCCSPLPDPAASRIVLDNDMATKLSADIKGRFIIGVEETQAYYFPAPSDTENEQQ